MCQRNSESYDRHGFFGTKFKGGQNFSFAVGAFSKHRPSGPMLSIGRNVRLSVCLSVGLFICVFTIEVPFKCLFAPTSRNRMSNILDIRNPWGKVMERNGLRFEHFCLKII